MAKPIPKIPWLTCHGGIYYANWYDHGARRTRRSSLRTRDDLEAQSRFGAFLTEGRRYIQSRPAEARLTVSQALEDYEREHVEKNCADAARQRVIIGHLRTFFKDTPMADIDIPMSRAYLAARMAGEVGGGKRRKDKTGGPTTVRRELNALVAAANHAIKWKRLEESERPRVELPKPERTDQIDESQWYSRAELDRLFAAADGDLLRFVRLTYYWGARRRSVERLEVEQIDMANGRVSLAKKGERVTKKRRPVVPIFPVIQGDIEALMAAAEASGSNWLLGRKDRYRDYVDLCRRAGLGHKAHPHMLRHTRATHLLLAGVSIYKVARLLGDTVKTVESVYGHYSPEDLSDLPDAA